MPRPPNGVVSHTPRPIPDCQSTGTKVVYANHIFVLACFRNPPAELNQLSCTDTAQAWGKVKGRDWYHGTPITDLCHVGENPHKVQPLTEEEEERCLQILVGACPNSALALHGKRKRHVEQPKVKKLKDDFVSRLIDRTCETLYVRDIYSDSFYTDVVALTYNESKELCRATMSQNSERWRHARSMRITASECYSMYTAKGGFEEKFLRTKGKFRGCKATRFGTTHEPVARDMYAAQVGGKVHQCGLVVPPMMPWLACSPDGVVVREGSVKLLEIKCPALCEAVDLVSNVRSKKLPYLLLDGENLTLKKKHKYYAQVQLSMTLLDLPTCDFVVFDKSVNRIHVLRVARDANFCGDLVRKLGEVYFDHVFPHLKRNGRH